MKIYLKHQVRYLLFLLALFVAPLALFFQFSTYELPKVQYVVLASLFASQYFFYRKSEYKQKIEKQVVTVLKDELGRVPSKNEIVQRLDKIVSLREVSIALTALCIVCIMLIFQRF